LESVVPPNLELKVFIFVFLLQSL